MTGFEPATSTLARWHSSQLSYIRILNIEPWRLEAILAKVFRLSIKIYPMQIKILAISKKTQAWVREAESDFYSRVKNFAELKIELIAPLDENALGVEKARRSEGEKLLEKIHRDEFVIACERGGLQLSSEKFAVRIGELRDDSRKIVFVIGGSNGLDPAILARSDLQVSFSDFTFPHELFRVILLEQIYRTFMILNNRKYHK